MARARAQEPRAIGRLLSLVEEGSALLPSVSGLLSRSGSPAQVVGVTGPPGVGKSTAVSGLVARLRALGRTVAVLAVDPSSPFTGGALLGDRIRMAEHSTDSGVYIRSMASRGHLGGLASAAPQALRILDSCGFDVVLVETVGVGQSEVEVVRSADTTVVLLAPGAGDSVQAAKAGILEIGDVYVVNKSDQPGADALARELSGSLALGDRQPRDWVPGVVLASARTGVGLDQVLDVIDRHREWGQGSGALAVRRRDRARAEVEAVALAAVRSRWRAMDPAELDSVVDQVVAGALTVHAAAERLLRP